MDVSLVMFKTDGSRRDFPLSRQQVVVGRKNDCDLRIPLTSVSRRHCELKIVDGQLKLRDLGSSNGTYHNSIRVQEAVLGAGDELVIGPVVFTVVIDGQPEDIKAVQTIIENGDAKDPAPSPPATEPAAVATLVDRREMAVPAKVEVEHDSPTVDLDDDLDDPIAALEALSDSDADLDDSGDFQIVFDDDDDEIK